jgi:anti-sigma factor RsiW
MTMGNEHPTQALQELLDERHDGATRAKVERHVAECERCRRELEVLRWTQRTLRDAATGEPVPPTLEDVVMAALDAEDGGAGAPVSVVRPAWRLLPAWSLPLAAAVVLGTLGLTLLLPRPGADVPALQARDFAYFEAGRLTLELEVDDVATIERFFSERDLGFEARVLDLAMMAYEPVGGRVHRVEGEPSALFVYRGPDGQILVCQMFLGRVTDLPAGAERRSNNGIEFRIYERDGRTVVAWQEGLVVCVLVSDIPREDVIQLAFAKAMKV